MNIRLNHVSLPQPRVVTGATIALALGALAAATVWMPGFAAVSPAPTAALFAAADDGPESPAANACAQCAVVISTREIVEHGGGPGGGNTSAIGSGGKRYEVTLRMQDGSTRVLAQARPAVWRARERLILIGGTSASREADMITPIAGNAR